MSDPTALQEAATRVVREARDFDMAGPLLLAVVALDDALRAAPPAVPSEDAALPLHNLEQYVDAGGRHWVPLREAEAAIRAAAGDGGLDVERLARALQLTVGKNFDTDLSPVGKSGALAYAADIAVEYAALAHTESATDGNGDDD